MNWKIWLESTKPKVFAASMMPVALGSVVAYADGVMHGPSVPLILICAMLIQLVSNWVNDIYDYKRGADERGRVGPRRVLVEGFITPKQLIRASWTAAIVCFLVGLPLILRSGWPTLFMGMSCLIAAWWYTGGRYNLAYHGLGDVAAFLFFGVVAVTGTYYVHATAWSMDAFIISISAGLITANILAVNNIRDIATDALVGKRTLAVRLGARPSKILYILLTITAIVTPCITLAPSRGIWMWLPLVSAPYAILLCTMVWKRQGADLNPALAGTGLLHVFYTLLTVMAFVFSSMS
jgi:1,4-dihydroxy-2-naphthoate polyprenyltransferase